MQKIKRRMDQTTEDEIRSVLVREKEFGLRSEKVVKWPINCAEKVR